MPNSHPPCRILLLLTTLFILITCTHSINIILHEPTATSTEPQPSTKKCFTSTVYKEERLLIEIELPILKPGLEVMIQVGLKSNGSQKVNSTIKPVLFETIKQARYKKTIEKESHNVQDLDKEHSFEYETCLFMQSKSALSTKPNTEFEPFLPSFVFSEQQKKRNTESYLISVKLLTNFQHVLEDKRSPSSPAPTTHTYTAQHLETLQQRSTKLLSIAKEQVKIHRQNEMIEMMTEKHVQDLEDSIYAMSITQSALLVFGSLMHVNLMRSYMKGSGLI